MHMNQRIFKKNADYNQIKETIIKELETEFTAREEEIKLGLQSFQKLSSNERIITVANLIDQKCPKFQKIASILSASILIDQYQKKAEALTDEELTLLSCFISIDRIEYQRECIEIYDHQILSQICRKTQSTDKRLNYLELLEVNFSNKGKKEEMKTFIHNKTREELDQLIELNDINETFERVVTREKLSL